MLDGGASLALIAMAGFVGGLVRGYSGFGFAMAAVPMLAVVVPPALAVPAVLLHELAIGLFSLRAERASLDWPKLRALAAGSIIGTPVGLLVLVSVPAGPMRIAIALLVIVSLGVIWRRRARPLGLGRATLGVAGFASGLLNGAAAMSGPPAIVVLLGSALSPANVRGLLVYFILFSAAIGVALSLASGIQGEHTLRIAATMAPGVLAGTLLGVRLFKVLPQAHYRAIAIGVLLVIAVGSLGSSIGAGALAHPTPRITP
ncbi:sulfite exporter TauE/SafE family protein [Acuticoccus sp. MNP-M23]|uniref:sulfite exporter TauE/SafE family protein n=1 Tax=Acuticoccus sp. MNP-M23 TaxID=3072793 RepID=UPI0028169A24|nr:sulfite exporter TauE/SafE family protein [Acuticoccus sp. MNP-M23]WMS45012.1 sulfite exporter TauE/SafE family protein [Acuticoccus sp. MNP-M23]